MSLTSLAVWIQKFFLYREQRLHLIWDAKILSCMYGCILGGEDSFLFVSETGLAYPYSRADLRWRLAAIRACPLPLGRHDVSYCASYDDGRSSFYSSWSIPYVPINNTRAIVNTCRQQCSTAHREESGNVTSIGVSSY